jgi:hypothetical protein
MKLDVSAATDPDTVRQTTSFVFDSSEFQCARNHEKPKFIVCEYVN